MRRNKHNLSHYHLLSCDMGQLVPVGHAEALPGDTIQHHSNLLVRVSPLVAPVMHPVTVRLHHFFVPYRLIWGPEHGDEGTFEDFITGGNDGNDPQTTPTYNSPGTPGTVYDYLGVPPSGSYEVSALPVRAYNLIFNEFYRDADLFPESALDNQDVKQIAWEKDYFSSARPWPQRGPDVTIPLGDRAYVKGIGMGDQDYTGNNVTVYQSGDTGTQVYANARNSQSEPYQVEENPDQPGFPNIYADLANAIGANINDVRKAFAIQRFQEARARYGARYTEYLRYLGVNPRDSRLQRPEMCGGGQTQLNFSEVLQTSPENRLDDPPEASQFGVGDMYGHGIAAMRSNKYRRFIEEHGIIMSLMSVRPKTIYTQGIHRSWLRKDKEDYYQRELEHIGQQEVLNQEIFAESSAPGETFGYQDRYREYREMPSYVSGEFRELLNYWHLGREFEDQPVLNRSFIECVPSKRIHNEQNHNSLWVMCKHRMVARRLLSRNAAPRLY